jgi:hypothetical protein
VPERRLLVVHAARAIRIGEHQRRWDDRTARAIVVERAGRCRRPDRSGRHPAELYDYDDDAFAIELASPADANVTIAIDGHTSGVTESSAFAVDVQASPDQVIVGWDPMANAVDGSTDVFVYTACGSNTFVSEKSPSGSAQQVLFDVAGGCTPTAVEVAQFAALAVDGNARVGFTRIVKAAIPSQP